MRRTLVIMGLGLGMPACGPVVDPPVDGTDSSSTAESGAPETGEPPPADASATSHGASTGAPSTSEGSADASSSGGDGLLFPPEAVITTVTCNDDGTMVLFIEATLMGVYDDCLPVAEIEGHLYFRHLTWDGLPGTFEVSPDGPILAAVGEEYLSGALTLEVWAPHHPSFATLDLAGPSTTLQGVLDLQTCAPHNDAPCKD